MAIHETTPAPSSPASQPLTRLRWPAVRQAWSARTAGLPLLTTWVAIRPHTVAAMLIVAATAVLIAGVGAVAAQLPRLGLMYAYLRLVRKGEAVASTAAEVHQLMTGLPGDQDR